jgi:hypothetical protein
MGKSILLFIYLLFTVSCVHPNIPSNIIGSASVSSTSFIIEEPAIRTAPEPVIVEDAYSSYDCLMDKSEEFIGVTERGGNNKDFTNKELKRMLVDAGWGPGQAWCSYMLKGLLDHCDVPNKVTGWSPTSYNKKDVVYTDGKFKQNYKSDDILVMSLSYAKFKNDRARYKGIGHTGVVKEVRDRSVVTYEGNTGDDGGRDGDGFYKKIRPLTKNLHITRHGIKN